MMHSTNLPYSSKDGDRKFRPAYATRRFTKRSYALLGIIVIGLLYYFNMNAAESTGTPGLAPYSTKTTKVTKAKDGKLRIAIVTMTTQQRSYSHVALENKWGTFLFDCSIFVSTFWQHQANNISKL